MSTTLLLSTISIYLYTPPTLAHLSPQPHPTLRRTLQQFDTPLDCHSLAVALSTANEDGSWAGNRWLVRLLNGSIVSSGTLASGDFSSKQKACVPPTPECFTFEVEGWTSTNTSWAIGSLQGEGPFGPALVSLASNGSIVSSCSGIPSCLATCLGSCVSVVLTDNASELGLPALSYTMSRLPDHYLLANSSLEHGRWGVEELCLEVDTCHRLELSAGHSREWGWRLGNRWSGSAPSQLDFWTSASSPSLRQGCEMTACEKRCRGKCFVATMTSTLVAAGWSGNRYTVWSSIDGVVASNTLQRGQSYDYDEVCIEQGACYVIEMGGGENQSTVVFSFEDVVYGYTGSTFESEPLSLDIHNNLVSCGSDQAELLLCPGEDDAVAAALRIFCDEVDNSTACLCHNDDSCPRDTLSCRPYLATPTGICEVSTTQYTDVDTEVALRSAFSKATEMCGYVEVRLAAAQLMTVLETLLVLPGASIQLDGHSSTLTTQGTTRLFAVGFQATLTLLNVTVTGCSVEGIGGAGALVGASAALWLVESRIERCNSPGDGGAVVAWRRANVTLQKSTLANNHAIQGEGGSLFARSQASVELLDGTELRGSIAMRGGCVALRDGATFKAADAKLIACGALLAGGAVYSAEASTVNFLARTAVINSTTLNGGGGGVFATGRSMVVANESAFKRCAATYTNEDGLLRSFGGCVAIMDSSTFLATGVSFQKCAVASAFGGAVHVEASSLVDLVAVEMVQCGAGGDGGAMSVRDGSLAVLRNGCSFRECQGRATGGCIAVDGRSVLGVFETIFVNCTAAKSGGAIFVHNAAAVIHSTTVTRGMSVFGSGGAIGLEAHASLDAKGCKFDGSQAGGFAGGALYAGEESSTVLEASVVATSFANIGGCFGSYTNARIELNSTILRECDAQVGGGLYLRQGATLHLDQESVVSRCRASTNGGGVFLAASSAASVEGSIQDCRALERGGGYYASTNAQLDLNGAAQVVANSANDFAGGIHAAGSATVTIREMAVISGNRASHGGGIFVSRDAALSCLGNSAIVNNMAQQDGGGVAVAGGVITLGGSSHVSANVAGRHGGGFALDTVGSLLFVAGPSCSWITVTLDFTSDTSVTTGSLLIIVSMETHSLLDARGHLMYAFASDQLATKYHWCLPDGPHEVMAVSLSSGGWRGGEATIFSHVDGSTSVLSLDIGQHAQSVNLNVVAEDGTPLVTDNSAKKGSGGGIWLSASARAYFVGGSLEGNSALSDGGAVAVESLARLYARGVRCTNNTAAFDGGGIKAGLLTVIELDDWIATANEADASGGFAMVSSCSSASFTNVDMYANVARDRGGALKALSTTNVSVVETRIVGNVARSRGGGVDIVDSRASFVAVVLANNTVVTGHGGALAVAGDEALPSFARTKQIRSCWRILTDWRNTTATCLPVHQGATCEYFTESCARLEGTRRFNCSGCACSLNGLERYFEIANSTDEVVYRKGPVTATIGYYSFCADDDQDYYIRAVDLLGDAWFGGSILVDEERLALDWRRPGNNATEWIHLVRAASVNSRPLSMNIVSGNYADRGGGGALFVDTGDDALPSGWDTRSVVLKLNRAAYGDNVASPARRLRSDAPNATTASGKPMGQEDAVRVSLFDAYEQLVTASTDVVAIATTSSGASLAARTTPFVNGIARFENLVISALPQSRVALKVSTTLDSLRAKEVDLSVTLRACEPGEESVGDERQQTCEECAPGTYSFEPGATCQSCVDHATCLGGTSLEPDRGYWRSWRGSRNVRRCPYERYCNRPPVDLWHPPNATVDSQCSGHHEGPLCAICENGYRLDPVKGKCYPCRSAAKRAVTIVLIALAAIFLLYIFITVIAVTLGSKSTRALIARCTDGLYVRAFVDDHWAKIQSIFKVWLVFTQITAGLSLAFPAVVLPPVVLNYQRRLSVLSLDFTGVLRRACVANYDHLDILVGMTLAPISLAAFVVLIGMVARMGVSHGAASLADRRSADDILKSRVSNILLVFSYVILTSVSRVVLRTFFCDDSFDSSSERDGSEYYGDSYLSVDYSVSCQSQRYRNHRLYAAYMLFVYPIGFPLVYFVALFRVKSRIAPKNVLALARELKDTAKDKEAEHRKKARASLTFHDAGRRSAVGVYLDRVNSSYMYRRHNRRADKWKDVYLLAEMYIAESKLDEEVLEFLDMDGHGEHGESRPQSRIISLQRVESTAHTASNLRPPPTQRAVSLRRSMSHKVLLQSSGLHRARLSAIGESLVLESRQLDARAEHVSFLFGDYDPACWYFEVVDSLRRVVLTCLFPLPAIHTDSFAQFVFGTLVALSFAALYSHLRPFVNCSQRVYLLPARPIICTSSQVSDTMDIFDNLMHMILVLNFLCLLIMFADQNMDGETTTGIRGKHFGGLIICLDAVVVPIMSLVSVLIETEGDTYLRNQITARRRATRPKSTTSSNWQFLRTTSWRTSAAEENARHETKEIQENEDENVEHAADRRARMLRAQSSYVHPGELVHPDGEVGGDTEYDDEELEEEDYGEDVVDDPLIGDHVTIIGLISRPSLNGRRGFCEGYIEDAGRYRVILGDTAYALKPANITLQPPATPFYEADDIDDNI